MAMMGATDADGSSQSSSPAVMMEWGTDALGSSRSTTPSSASPRCQTRQVALSGKDVDLELQNSSDPQTDDDLNEELEKNRRYARAGAFGRALPERYFALLVTLLVELPVAFIISGGSTELKAQIGIGRYTLLMAFLPLTSAISGNVGLQASTLTTRAISHGDCSRANWGRWLRTEMATAGLLALFVGLAVGLLALCWTAASIDVGLDVGFALTVGVSQAFSVAIAGLTGTCAPLLFSFVFRRDAGKWAGPLETAVQDIAGSFAMVFIAQVLLMEFMRLGLSPETLASPAA